MSKQIKREIDEHISFQAHLEPEKTKDLGNGILEATITTGALDHHNEKILMSGVDTTTYHGPVLYGHDYEGLPIGKTLSLTKMATKIKARFQLATDIYPFANTVYEMIKGGYLSDVSIGGLVKQWSADYQTVEQMVMKEFSVVPIGANPEAIITAKSLGKSVDDLKKEYQEFVHASLVDKMADMGDDEVNQAIRVLGSLLVTLKESAGPPSDGEPEMVKRIKTVRLGAAKALNQESERLIRIIKLKK